MSNRLPEYVDPLRMGRKGEGLTGIMPVTGMSRLGQSLHSLQGVAEFELHFGVDEMAVLYVEGRVRARLELVCQRCLEPFSFPVDAQLCQGIVTSMADAERLPQRYDPLLMEQKTVSVRTLIEDELILSLPVIAYHPPGSCPGRDIGSEEQGSSAGIEGDDRDSPFSVLARLKQDAPED